MATRRASWGGVKKRTKSGGKLFGDEGIRPKVNATTVRLGTSMGGITRKQNSNKAKQQNNRPVA